MPTSKPRYIVREGTAEVPTGKTVYLIDEYIESPYHVAIVGFLPCGRAPHRQIQMGALEEWPYDELDID